MKIRDYGAFYFLGILFLFAWIVVLMFMPYINAILLAAILAGAFHPLIHKLVAHFKISHSFSVWLVTLFMMIILIVPSIYVTIALTKEIATFINSLQKYEISRIFKSLYATTGSIYLPIEITTQFNLTADQIDFAAEAIKSTTQEISTFVLNQANSLLSDTLGFLVQFFIFIVSVFVFLKKGRLLKEFIVFFIPLSKKNSFELIEQIGTLNYLTIVGNGIGGIIQGTLGGLVFFISGAENNIMWSVIMIILAFIPLIGISIVYIPYTIILIAHGDYVQAAFVFISCGIISFIVENIYKPKFIGKRINFNSVLLLFGIIGGLSLFGIAGIFYGPLIILIFLFLLKIAKRTFSDDFNNSPDIAEIIYRKNKTIEEPSDKPSDPQIE